jgi:beta-alanine degradation protein BauB
MGTHRIENWPRAAATMARDLQKEFAAHAGDGRVGKQLLSDTGRVRVWAIGLKRGQRPGFHTHVVDYFWTSVTGGHGRSHVSDGFVSDTAYKPGDIKDRYSETSNTRGAPRRSSDGPRRLGNGTANPWNRLKRTRKWRPATVHAKDAA